MVTIRIPASSANLGPGFDSFGIALSLYNNYTFELADRLKIIGCPPEYSDDRNLSIIAFKATLKVMGKPYTGVKMTVDAHIPFCSGLGSSAATIVAGAKGANALYGNPLSNDDLLQICNAIEGHPDNVAPAIYGGMTVSVVQNGRAYCVQYPVHPELKFVVMTPDFELATKDSRRVLPQMINRQDAIYNLSHAGLLPKALELGDERLIRLAVQDRLHEPYRRPLITDLTLVEKAANDLGAIAFCISGAGPTCLAITKDPDFAEKLKEELHTPHSNWTINELEIAK